MNIYWQIAWYTVLDIALVAGLALYLIIETLQEIVRSRLMMLRKAKL